jgi:DNA mismatch endonuclease, patch repair protein
MSRVKTRDTGPEVAVRSELHRLGLRFRIDRRPSARLRRRADILFPRQRVAVFVDGCFWHGCPEHVEWPSANGAWWRAKIEGTRIRDRETDELLATEGWSVIRVWEHDDPSAAAGRIAAVVHARSRPKTPDPRLC